MLTTKQSVLVDVWLILVFVFCLSSFLCLILSFVQTLEMLEKKEGVLQKKAAAEVERAKEYTKAKNKRGVFAVFFPVSSPFF